MKARRLALKLSSVAPSLATATGPVFAMLDPPDVYDAHGDRMAQGALRLPPPGEDGLSKVPLYWLHSYSDAVVLEASPAERVAIGEAVVWEEDGFPYFTPRFYANTEVSEQAAAALEAGEILACSVGYLTEEASPNDRGGEDVTQARLIEVSLVDKGAKPGAVRVKTTMTPEDVKQLTTALVSARAEAKALKLKSMGVEMMCSSRALYFATEMMEHCAEAMAACQSFLKDTKEYQPGKDPLLSQVATAAVTNFSTALTQLATWLGSPEARGESAAPSEPEAKAGESTAPPEDVVMKFLSAFRKPAV